MSEPDNVWVAARQDRITADQEKSQHDTLEGEADNGQPHDCAVLQKSEETEAALLSGESERIGTQNFDEDTPFGERVVII
ncbi:hypothetical protein ACQKKX_17670 [Neorhizobium sp. NPDC001467]|uniref:hypothetical protein n=1 Tax=Neorhizobium sp. NPDC001467 TaxID=3390595 RepID=UPI003D037B2D